jgi:hypothetical protein
MNSEEFKTQALARYPSLTSQPATPEQTAMGDQLSASLTLAHDLTDQVYGQAKYRYLWVHLGGDRLVKFRTIAEQAAGAYKHDFGSADGFSDASGQTVESGWSVASTPDTRVFAIVPRWPFERTPIASLAELNSQIAKVTEHRLCDLKRNGGLCDGAAWSESTVLPVVRGELLVLISACEYCLKSYAEQHGISGGEVIDPDDVID